MRGKITPCRGETNKSFWSSFLQKACGGAGARPLRPYERRSRDESEPGAAAARAPRAIGRRPGRRRTWVASFMQAHPRPLPCLYQAEEDSFPAWEGEIYLYSHSKGGFHPPLGTPVKGVLLWGPRREATYPPPVSPGGCGIIVVPTPWSRLPARVLRPGGARPGPTAAAAETGSRQSATGARSPPPAPIHRRDICTLAGAGGDSIFNI